MKHSEFRVMIASQIIGGLIGIALLLIYIYLRTN